ncbi:hypothetical protein QFW77_05705 [Luteimonas sp. RD2P54]|uniref:Uncharacterized protein n=1 Tax=Luteimonas endophytica TaxID=3042023 RepID=A0ABT6J7B2_9GAMM|nr:hypothetical protein [Luteimonas endophytica]MDH5822485.1 hypothetical protein [Luteimonas endophytica]
MRRNSLLFACALALFAPACEARQRMLHMSIQDQGGLPCFGVADTREARRYPIKLGAMVVSELDASENVVREVWSLAGRMPPVMLDPAQCLPYGAQPEGAEALVEAAPVQPGKRYSAFINAYIQDGAHWNNRSYLGAFCVTEGPEGRQVHQITSGPVADQARWAACQATP